MDTSQWAQGNIGVVKVAGMVELGSNKNPIIAKPLHDDDDDDDHVASNPGMVERKGIRPHQKDQVLNCPRCNSSNTKFCYYNNYSLSQPRYFCKTCRRYWTEGGSLRNVPVGGGSRKNKLTNRPSSSSSSLNSTASNSSASNSTINPSSSILKKQLPQPSLQNPQDLNLAYPPPSTRSFNLMTSLMPNMSLSSSDGSTLMYSSTTTTTNNNNSGGGGFFPLQEFKPLHHEGLNFSFEGFENTNNNGYVGGFQGIQLGAASDNGAARILFPIQDLKHNLPTPTTPTTTPTITHEFQQHNDHNNNNNNNNNHRGGGGISHGDNNNNNNSSGFWSGMLGGAGSSW